MNDQASSNTANPQARAGIGAWLHMILTQGMFGVAAIMGLLVLFSGLRLLVTGEQHWGLALMITAMGLLFSTIGIGFFYLQFFKLPVLRTRRQVTQARYPGQPWMLRSDWATRRVTDPSLGAMIFMWVWLAGWWGAIVFIWNVNRDKILAAVAKSWGEAVIALIFPLAGLIGIYFAVQMTRTWLRYGRSVLRIDTLPGYLGERFRGSLQANFRERPIALEAELACNRVMWATRRRNGKTSRQRVTTTIWSETHALDASRMMRAGRRSGAMLSINLPLPGDQPPCELDENDEGIEWQLTVREVGEAVGRRAGDAGGKEGNEEPLFSATFDVPVFARDREGRKTRAA